MAKAEIVLGELGGGTEIATLKDYIYDKVTNDSLSPTYSFVKYSSYDRATLNEGKVVVDTVAKSVYLYVDFTVKTAIATNGYILNTTPLFDNASYRPKGQTNTTVNGPCICAERLTSVSGSASMIYNAFKFVKYSNDYIGLMTDQLQCKVGERYVVYAVWQYDY